MKPALACYMAGSRHSLVLSHERLGVSELLAVLYFAVSWQQMAS